MLDVASVTVHGLTNIVSNHRNCDLLECRWKWAICSREYTNFWKHVPTFICDELKVKFEIELQLTFIQSSPSYHQKVVENVKTRNKHRKCKHMVNKFNISYMITCHIGRSANEIFIDFRYTDWYDVWLKYDRFIKSTKFESWENCMYQLSFFMVWQCLWWFFTSIKLNRIQMFVDRIVDARQQFVLFVLDIHTVPPRLINQIHPFSEVNRMVVHWKIDLLWIFKWPSNVEIWFTCQHNVLQISPNFHSKVLNRTCANMLMFSIVEVRFAKANDRMMLSLRQQFWLQGTFVFHKLQGNKITLVEKCSSYITFHALMMECMQWLKGKINLLCL